MARWIHAARRSSGVGTGLAGPQPQGPRQAGGTSAGRGSLARRARKRWARTSWKARAVLAAGLLVTGVVAAAILLRQDVAITTGSQDSDVVFVDRGGAVPGYSSISVGTSGASATVTITGVAGAANLQVTSLLGIQNTDASQAYTVTLANSGTIPAAVSGLTYTVLNGSTTVDTFTPLTESSGSFTLPVSTTFDIRIDIAITDGTAASADLGSFTLQFSIAAV